MLFCRISIDSICHSAENGYICGMEENKKIVIIDLTENEEFNKYLDDLVKSSRRARRIFIVFIAVVLPLLFSLLLLTENM